MNSRIDAYDHAASEYEARQPEYPEEECAHSWRYLGESDGDCYYKCRKCGAEGSN